MTAGSQSSSSTATASAAGGGAGRGRSSRPTATHLFNGMRPLHHRDPGPIAACLAAAARGDLVVELVADGTHLADGTVRAVFDLVGPDAIALVTDAMAAAGMADGDYQLGPMAVRSLYADLNNVARLDWVMVLTAVALSIVAAVLAGLFPTWRACQITPAVQLKTQ